MLAATTFGVGSMPGKPRAIALLTTPYRNYSRSHLKAIAPRLYGGQIGRQPELLDRHAYSRVGHAPRACGHVWQLAALAEWSSPAFTAPDSGPVLVLTGGGDPIIRVFNGRVRRRLFATRGCT